MSNYTPPWTPTKLLKSNFSSDDNIDLIMGCEHEYYQEWFLECEMAGKSINFNAPDYPYLAINQFRPGDGTLNVLFRDEQEALDAANVTKKVCDDFGIPYSYVVEDFTYDPAKVSGNPYL